MSKLRCIVIGAGVSGLLIAQKLKEAFMENFEIQIFEKNADVGGTWLENRYPGCACDVPSHIYQYSFAPNPYWSRMFAGSAEIQSYLKAFTKHFDIERCIRFSTPVTKAEWNERQCTWTVEVNDNERHVCDVLINAGGILNNPNYPRLKNLDIFQGALLHTAAWDSNVSLHGKRVAIIGAGASAIQLLPAIQPHVYHADIYVRTPSWITKAIGIDGGKAFNKEYTEEEIERYCRNETYSLEQRKQMEDMFNEMFPVFQKHSEKQRTKRIELEASMRNILRCEQLREKLIPKFEVGCRRLNPGKPYLHAIQKPNIEPIFDEIEEVTPAGIRSGGQERAIDIIILATGFDTSFRPRFPIIGAKGHNLQNLWQHDPVSYLGTAVSGFPNYLTFLGPNTPIANGSLMGTIEATAEFFVRLLTKKQRENIASFDVWPEVQADFAEHTQEFMKDMVWTGTCRSWYKRGEDGKVTAIWPGSSLHYREVLEDNRWEDFRWKYHGNRFGYWKDGRSKRELETDPTKRDLSYYMLPHPNLPRELFRPENLGGESCGDRAEDTSVNKMVNVEEIEQEAQPVRLGLVAAEQGMNATVVGDTSMAYDLDRSERLAVEQVASVCS